jgi:predicted TPR repeat methyltransferase
MRHPATSDSTLPDKEQELLRRAYGLSSDEESQALYRDWAKTYDKTMLDGLHYQSPRLVAARLADFMPARDSAVLDIGCGTGLVGRELAARGFMVVDGIDISPEMMAVAREQGGYRDLVCADLNARLPLADGAYQGAICCGTFTSGHVRANCLDEIVRVLAAGAPFAFTVKLQVWESFGFKDKLAQLERSGAIAIVAMDLGSLYADSPEPDGMFCNVRRL